MRRWIIPFLLLVVAGVAAWQAVVTDEALAAETVAEPSAPGPSLDTPLASFRRIPEYLRAPAIENKLVSDLEQLSATFPTQSCLVVRIDGEEVFASNPTLPLVPASAQKIITAFGVYEMLGPDHTFETRVVTDAAVVDGVLDGDLWLIGGGDPLVATTEYTDRYEFDQALTDLDSLADAVVASGITEISGAVFGDESRYDDQRYVPSWPDRFTNLDQNQTGPLSALTVNDGFLRFDATNPANSLSTAASDPAQFAAAFFDDLLEERGVIIRQSAGSGTVPVGATNVVDPLVSDLVTVATNQMVSVSDNMGAEMLLKELGFEASGLGTTLSGSTALEAMLRERGLSVAETDVVDGSGLSSDNRVTCRLLVEVLDASANTGLHDGLAIAGESGTLEERLVGTPAEGRLAGKTGRLNDVGALAGTAVAEDGTVLTFAWVANTTDFYPIDEMTASQDQLALELISYPEGPSADVLSPGG
jgi:D-alanyl-D-alanine carboxypeptidase/D-alanyl-D-alanine-endopeptidase (penicillin-binding protein 4)